MAGSLATGDYRLGVSDPDLVALVDGPGGVARQATIVAIHRDLDEGMAAGLHAGG